MVETLPDPSASDPERIKQELMAEAERELARRAAEESRKKSRPPADSDAETVLSGETLRVGGTSVYRVMHPASPVSAMVASALLAALAMVAGSGIGLALGFAPTAEDAYSSVGAMHDSAAGAALRSIHYQGANVLVYLSVVYVMHLIWSGFFRRPGHWIWWRALALCLLVLLFGATGQLLPMDQNAVHGTHIRLGYLADVPVAGEALRSALLGGDEIGTATVARFYALHAIVLPALGLVLLRRFWRDARQAQASRASLLAHGLVIGLTVLLVLFLGSVSPAPLGLSGDLGEPFEDARPEWYALPLYQLLKWLPAGVMQLLGLVVLPLGAAALLMVLPWLERVSAEPARLRWPLRLLSVAVLALCVGLGVWPLIEDVRANEGQGAGLFARHDVEHLMEALKRRNDALGHSRHEGLPDDAHRHARDIWQLAQQLREPLRRVPADERAKYPERPILVDYNLQPDGRLDDVRARRWREWVDAMEAGARRLYAANSDADQRKAREEIRKACVNCHDSYDVNDPVNPEPRRVVFVTRTVEVKPEIKPEVKPEALLFFDEAKFKGLKAAEVPGKTSTLMKRMKTCCVELLQHAELLKADKPPTRSIEQAFLDLQACSAPLPVIHDQFKKTFPYPGWKQACDDTDLALRELLKARRGDDFKARILKLGRACDTCHELNEEVDFRFSDLFK